MELNYVLGRTGRGKTKYVFGQIKSLVDQDKLCRIIVIVPEQATFRMERDLIKSCHLLGLFNVSVVSFDRLVHEILNTCGGRTLAPLDFIGKTMVVRSLLDTHRDELKIFGKSAGMPGFEIKMTEMLTELKRQDVNLIDLQQAAKLKLEPTTLEKLADVALMFSAYREQLAGLHMDSEDLISLALEKATSHQFFSGAHVFVDGFDLLTHQLLSLLMIAVQQAVSTTITFMKNVTASSDNRIFSPEDALYLRISEAAKKLGIQPKEIKRTGKSLEETKYRSAEILHLEQNLFAYPFKPYPSAPKDIVLSALDNKSLEVTDVCAKIIDLTKSGIRFRDIAVCISDIDAYREALSFHLHENRIPFFMDAKTKLTDTAFAEFLISLLDFILYKDTADFIVHIKSGFLDIPSDDLFAVENYLRRYPAKGYAINYAFKHAEAATEKARKRLADPVFELMRSLKSAKTAESFGEDILTYLKVCQVDKTVERFAKTLEEKGNLENAQVFSQIFEKIVDIIRQACIMFKGKDIAFDSFVSAVKAGLEAVEIAVIPPSTDDVLVGDFNRTAFPPVKALFILGLNDGKIPSSPDASAVLTDAEKYTLEKQGLRAGYRDRFFEERIRIYSVFAGPTERLFLSYPSGSDKDAQKPSILIQRISKLFPRLTESTYVPRTQVNLSLSEENLLRNLSLSLNQKLEGLPISDTWRDIYAHFESQREWQPRIARFTERLKQMDKTETVDPALVRRLYPAPTASITRVEKFYGCPMHYFLNYGIKLKKAAPLQETPLEMGSFLHACLHAFVQTIKKEKTRWGALTDEQLTRVAETVCESVRKSHNGGIFYDRAFMPIYKRLKLDFISAVRTIRDQLSDTDVAVFASELTLENAPFLRFKLADNTELNLTCKIDRVDVLNTGPAKAVRVIDYKLSGKTINLKDVYFGINIQLLIYLKLVLEYFKSNGETVMIGGAFYYDLSLPMSDDVAPEKLLSLKRMNGFLVDNVALNEQLSKRRDDALVATQGSITKAGTFYRSTKNVFSDQQFDLLFNYCEELMVQAFTRIFSGEITPKPYKSGQDTACDTCDFKSICLFDEDLDAYQNIDEKTIQDFGWDE